MSFKLDLENIERRRLIPGLVLIALGLLGLLSTLGWFGGARGIPGAALFGGAAYLAHLQARRTGSRPWQWAVYPLAGLAIAALLPAGSLGGAAFLGSIGVVFLLIYRDNPVRWWAVIPAGALFSLAATALVDGMSRMGGAGGSVFLLGLAATFFVLTRLPQHAQPWAIFPAGALALLAVIGPMTGSGWAVPVLLIVIGAWLLLRREERASAQQTVEPVTATAPAPQPPQAPAPQATAVPAPAPAPAPQTAPAPAPAPQAAPAPAPAPQAAPAPAPAPQAAPAPAPAPQAAPEAPQPAPQSGERQEVDR
jgi:hypothetical protein